MTTGADIFFAPFRLDVLGEQLWRDDHPVTLRPKTFAVLRYLVERAQRLVKKEELLHRLWGDVAVSDDVLKTSLKEIRHALGDSARQPRYVATAHGRGYRFIGSIASAATRSETPDAGHVCAAQRILVGRQEALSALENALELARAGERQVVFVAGEPGIGKTSLLDEFVARVRQREGVYVARSRCVEQHMSGEPYLPVLEALERLCQSATAAPLFEALEQAAPSWIDQMPLLSARSSSRGRGAPAPLRMPRELAEALERGTQTSTLILCFDDLHFADSPTLDLLHYVGQR
ncbi:MAG TPA: BREX system ATP-binding domain-containing protein, partial [Polyangiaceae bacterium]|nr:BREX system ATP-binding domain-containing protein [Polyangiaceae bacterium]